MDENTNNPITCHNNEVGRWFILILDQESLKS